MRTKESVLNVQVIVLSLLKKPKEVHQPDDKFFKEVMLRKASVREYLSHFHPKVAKLVDLRTLKLSKESFISPDLATFTSDIVWKAKLKNSDKEAYLSFLWEHKMQEHIYYAIQAGLYIFLFLHRKVNIDKKPPEPILPLLFYHGKKNDWKPPTVHELFANMPGFELIKKHIPDFEPLFLNLARKPKEEIASIQGDFLRSALYAFSMRHDSDLLLDNISVIFDLEADEFERHPLFVYVFSVINKPKKEIIKKLKEIDFKNKNTVMNTLQLIKQEGLDEGIKIGIQKGIHQGHRKRRAKKDNRSSLCFAKGKLQRGFYCQGFKNKSKVCRGCIGREN